MPSDTAPATTEETKAPENGVAEAEATPAAEGPITLSSDDALTLRSAQNAITGAQARMGALREQFLQDELNQLQTIQKARQSFEGVIRTLAEKHGIDLANGQWMFNLETMTFSKRPAQ